MDYFYFCILFLAIVRKMYSFWMVLFHKINVLQYVLDMRLCYNRFQTVCLFARIHKIANIRCWLSVAITV